MGGKNGKPPGLDFKNYPFSPAGMWPIGFTPKIITNRDGVKTEVKKATDSCPCGGLCQFCREKNKK